jgi:hypothetical protein
VYVRVWEYEVSTESVGPFVAAYGPDGAWSTLFRRGRGYLGTDLYREDGGGVRFLTVDRWVDEDSWRSFLDTSGSAYDALDARLEGLATTERELVEGNG